MSSRQEILQDLVLNSFADDFEDFEMIVHEVTQWGNEKDLTFSREEIAAALEQSISNGHAQAYVLSPTMPSRTAKFSREHIDDFYFYLTPAGRELLPRMD
jgi:hypothetical protein